MSKRVIILVLVLIASMVMLHAADTWTVTGRVSCTCDTGIPNVQINLSIGNNVNQNQVIAVTFTDEQGFYEFTINRNEFRPGTTFWVRDFSEMGKTLAHQITHNNQVINFERFIVSCKGMMLITWPPYELPIPPPKIKF